MFFSLMQENIYIIVQAISLSLHLENKITNFIIVNYIIYDIIS